MKTAIRRGTPADVDELERLYNELNDYLAEQTNYPGWRKGVYPTRETAHAGVAEGTLKVLCVDGIIAGTLVLSHVSEQGYDQVEWGVDAAAEEIFVVHTLAVHPAYLGQGVGKQLLVFAAHSGRERGMKAIRLDVFEENEPAIRLYQKSGYRFAGKVDMGLSCYGLDWFDLYELVL